MVFFNQLEGNTVFHHSLGHYKDFADLRRVPFPRPKLKLIYVFSVLLGVILLSLGAIGRDRRVQDSEQDFERFDGNITPWDTWDAPILAGGKCHQH